MNKRASGVLLHITSLPSPYGIGDLGSWAYQFADFLHDARQSYWQVLPLSPTAPVYGNSPYSSVSAFAGNTLVISPELLLQDGLINESSLGPKPSFPSKYCDYNAVIDFKERVLGLAHEAFQAGAGDHDGFAHFCHSNATWLDDYALFLALKKRCGGKPWNEWPQELKYRNFEALEATRAECATDIEREKFSQYLFFYQWHRVKEYCNTQGIQIVGDMPIYVSYDSADAWVNPAIFKLDEEREPVAVAGVPPDYFCCTGQLWGNPVYNWDALRETGYAWWIERMHCTLKLYDIVRIDHFRGLVAYWEVPAHEETAMNGSWADVPTDDFFNRLFAHFVNLPIIAEDLGLITPDVKQAMERFGFPGMKVLLFAFGEDNPMHIYLPHTHTKNYIVYTGTHDNNTVRGWFDGEAKPEEKERLFRYIGREVPSSDVCWEFIRLAMMSVADTAIIPMQDILGLGSEAQMNKPSIAHGNWKWRLSPKQVTGAVTAQLGSMTRTYGRG